MKFEEATDTIAKFFNDLIGAWVPGAVLAAGLAVMHLGPLQLQSIPKLGDTTSAALTFAGILFALGHALLAIHEQILKWLLSKLRVAKSFDEAAAKKRQSYEWFAELVKAQQAGGAPRIGATTTFEAWLSPFPQRLLRWAAGSCSSRCCAMG